MLSSFTESGVGRGAERERERERDRETERQRDRENSNSKTLILKDSSVRSIWTYLTASPCYTTKTNKRDKTTNRYSRRERERARKKNEE